MSARGVSQKVAKATKKIFPPRLLANSCRHTADWQSAIRQMANLRYERGAIPGRKCLMDNVCSPRNSRIMAQKAQKAQKCFQASRQFLEIPVTCVSVLTAPNRANRERSMSLYYL